MTYRMIAIDIDDTLLTDELAMTEPTKQALDAAIAAGVIVTLATGRMFASAKEVAKQLALDVPVITYQGALVKNTSDESVLYERYVPLDIAEFVIDYANEHGYFIQSYVDDRLYVSERNERAIAYSTLVNIPFIYDPQLQSVKHQPTAKLLFIDEPEVLDQLATELKPHLHGRVHMTKSKPNYLELTHIEATKGHAVRHVAHHFGIERSQVIAIGDSWNDIEMIEYAGLGVAMGNAVQPLKEKADYITKTNNDDGVKHVIDTFILTIS